MKGSDYYFSYVMSEKLLEFFISILHSVVQKEVYSHEYSKHSLFLHYHLLIIVLFFISTAVNVLLLHSV